MVPPLLIYFLELGIVRGPLNIGTSLVGFDMSLGRPWTRVYEFEMRLANIEKSFWDEFGVRLVDLE